MDLTVIIQILSIGLTIGALYALIAVGLNLIYGTMRLLNIAHGELIMMGAYLTYSLFTGMGVSPLLSIFAVMLFSLLFGLVICAGIFLPLVKNRAQSVALNRVRCSSFSASASSSQTLPVLCGVPTSGAIPTSRAW